MLIIVLGLPGTGKTYFAQQLAERIAIPHFNTDQVRDELNLKGHYDGAAKQQVYDQLFQKALDAFEAHSAVIIDATFSQKHHREQIKKLTERKGQPLYFIKMTADEATIRQRVAQSRKDSEADFSVYQQVKQAFHPLEEPHLTLNSSQQSAEEMVVQVLSHLSLPS